MPKGRISTKNFSDIINDYTNEEKLAALYFYLYISSGLSFESLQTWRQVKDPNIKLRRKKPMKFTVGTIKDPEAYNADTNLLAYTKPEMVEEDYSLDQRLEVGRQYSTLDVNTSDFIDSEMVEVTDIEKELKREAITKELQLNANKYQVEVDANAYDIWETIFKAARKTGINLNKMILLVPDSLLLEWRRLKLFENAKNTDVVVKLAEEDPLTLDGAFKDTISGITFIAIPDVYEAIATDGTVREVKTFNDDVKAVFYEKSSSIRVLDCVYMEHTPLRMGEAGFGTGYGKVKFMEKISYYGCNLLEPKKAGQIVVAAEKVKTAAIKTDPNELQRLKDEVKALEKELESNQTKSSEQIADLTKQLKEANDLIEAMDQPASTGAEEAK